MIKKIYIFLLFLVTICSAESISNASSSYYGVEKKTGFLDQALAKDDANNPKLPSLNNGGFAKNEKQNKPTTEQNKNNNNEKPTNTTAKLEILTPPPAPPAFQELKTITPVEKKTIAPKKEEKENKKKEKSKPKTKTKDKIINQENKEKLVNQLMDINYHTQNPPKKLYDREYSLYNKHLPPVYFKSYYLALAFKAVEKDDRNALNAVLAKYNFLNGQNKDGDTILIHSVQYNNLNSSRILLAKGAYVDAVNNRKRTALHYAAALGNIELVKLLLSMGADYTLTDDLNMTALDYASSNKQTLAEEIINQYIRQNELQQN
jgi:hypothetical protein